MIHMIPVSLSIYISSDVILNNFAKDVCEKFADRNEYSNFDKMLTFRELDKKVEALAAYFQGIGLKKSNRVEVQLPNIFQTPITILATQF